ncbi:hypothetical protein [Acinetobacter wanghuae]|uniref:hypothetical protein n=1 Tax=Acinetobacter wanghuae TaxID=2662362 RepID=UPI003AF45846
MHYALEFDDCDNPMYLKKVGNWVITFLNAQDSNYPIQLAMTTVLPRSADSGMQLRCIILQQHTLPNHWHIDHIECFDSTLNQECVCAVSEPVAQTAIERVLKEFERYDVCIKLKEIDE